MWLFALVPPGLEFLIVTWNSSVGGRQLPDARLGAAPSAHPYTAKTVAEAGIAISRPCFRCFFSSSERVPRLAPFFSSLSSAALGT